jgi:hypothetical protein
MWDAADADAGPLDSSYTSLRIGEWANLALYPGAERLDGRRAQRLSGMLPYFRNPCLHWLQAIHGRSERNRRWSYTVSLHV